MLDTDHDTIMMAREIGNLRFLIEHQLDQIVTLERQGLDSNDASDLLARLMRRDEDLRRRMDLGSAATRLGHAIAPVDASTLPGLGSANLSITA